MALHLTADMLEQAYCLLQATPPFRGWKLPPADEVEFRVTRTDDQGDFLPPSRIGVSAKRVASLNRLIVVTAHEMVHMRQARLGRYYAGHNAEFYRLAAIVCRHHLFDPKEF